MLSAYVKIPDSMLSSATGLCKGFDSTTQTPLSFTSNLFENASLQVNTRLMYRIYCWVTGSVGSKRLEC